jgi:XTP/dITP diphosphohydrolase
MASGVNFWQHGGMNSQYPTVVLASRNHKKSAEIRALLAPYGIPLISVADFPSAEDVVEDGDSFRANAEKKASQTALTLHHWAIGEDSGLRVDALKGDPGIYSARYSGPGATDESNNAKLIDALKNVPDDKRGAEYVCHIAVSDPNGVIELNVEATCRGRISREPRGRHGFGYDPYFLVREYHRTFGELSPLVKQHLSHRARAFERLIPLLLKRLSDTAADERA